MSYPNPLRQSVAGALRAEMARRKLTSSDLARALNCSQSSASRRMTADIAIDLDELEVIATWLGVTAETLVAAPPPRGDAA